MTGTPELRHRFNVGALKIPHAQRDVAHAVLADGDRGWRDILGADTPDDHDRHPVGAIVSYTLELTDAEAARFRRAKNCRYVEADGESSPGRAVGRPVGTAPIPSPETLAYSRLRTLDLRRWHGRDVKVAVLDSGTTAAVRAAMGWTLVGRTITSGVTMPVGRETYSDLHTHGCLVAPNAVPAGGLLLDVIITGATIAASFSAQAAGITWAVDQGARVINLSYGQGNGPGLPDNYSQALLDAVNYAAAAGAQIVISAGNDSAADINYPSSISRTHTNVHSSVAFDEATDRRAGFSNHHPDASGCAAGVNVLSLNPDGSLIYWEGTSASAPHKTQMIARGATGGGFTAAQVAAALRANTRNTGAGAAEQGAGAWDLPRALAALSAIPAAATAAGVATPTYVGGTSGAGLSGGYLVAADPAAQPDDVQLIFVVASQEADVALPDGCTLLTYLTYTALDQPSTVEGSTVWVAARPYTAATLSRPTPVFFDAPWVSGIAALTVRCPGGFDPERFAPIPKFGTGASLDAVPVLPANTNDLLVCMFAQRHPAAPAGTLSLPAGLTQRGFVRPSTGTTGYTMLVAAAPLTSGGRTPPYISTSNSGAGTWCTVALTLPGVALPIPTVNQPNGPLSPAAFMPLFAHVGGAAAAGEGPGTPTIPTTPGSPATGGFGVAPFGTAPFGG